LNEQILIHFKEQSVSTPKMKICKKKFSRTQTCTLLLAST